MPGFQLEAFAAKPFFTAGMGIFDSDGSGRTRSAAGSGPMAGTLTLMATTLLYVMLWEINGPLLGLAVITAARARFHFLRRRRCPAG